MKGRPVQPAPQTPEEKAKQFLAALARKREHYASNILFALAPRDRRPAKKVVARAVALADALLETLYPIPQEQTDEE